MPADPLGPLRLRLKPYAARYADLRDKSGQDTAAESANAVVEAALLAEFGPPDQRSDEEMSAFIADTLADARARGLLAAMAGLVALRQHLWRDAESLAERMIAGDQHDLFAQRLLLASREHSADLTLEVDAWLRDRFCGNPFEEIEVRADGKVNTCCSAWMPRSIGSVYEADARQFWNSTAAADIRRSVHEGDFSYCSRLYCPKIVKRTLPKRAALTQPLQRACASMQLTAVDHQPRRVVLSQDRSCNLSCPSCRTELIQMGKKQSMDLDALFDARIAALLTEARRIKITGSGDPFGSRHFRHVLKRLTASAAATRRIQIQTNGVLFDARAWRELGLEGHVDTVWISIDAARAETYRIVRRGGDFDRLMENLGFLGALRAEKRFNLLRLDFVVQASNFDEIPAFVDLARRVGADGVHFLMLRNWGTFSPQEYQALNVGSPAHPRHGAFLKVLAGLPANDPFIDLGNVAEWLSHEPARELMQPIGVDQW